MNRFLLGALTMGALVALASFSLVRSAPASPPLQAVPALHYEGMPLTHAFRQSVVVTPGMPLIAQMPASGGLAITQITARDPNGAAYLTVSVNGAAELLPNTAWNAALQVFNFNPPIIARPGDVLTFSVGGSYAETVVIGGYTTYPGET